MVLCYLSLFPALKEQQPSCTNDVTNQYSKDVNIIGCQPCTICFQTFSSVSSVTQSYPTLCNPMDCMDRLPCPSPTPKLAQIHVHRVGDTIQPSHPLLSPFAPAFNLSQNQGLFQCEANNCLFI